MNLLNPTWKDIAKKPFNINDYIGEARNDPEQFVRRFLGEPYTPDAQERPTRRRPERERRPTADVAADDNMAQRRMDEPQTPEEEPFETLTATAIYTPMTLTVTT